MSCFCHDFSKGEGHTYPCNLNPSAVVTAASTFKILIVWLEWLSSSHMRPWLMQRDRSHWRPAMESSGWKSGGERIFKATGPRWWTDKMQRYQRSNWEKEISKRIRKRTLGMKRIKNNGFVVMGLVVMTVEFSLIWHYLSNTWWCDLGIQKIWHFTKRLSTAQEMFAISFFTTIKFFLKYYLLLLSSFSQFCLLF